jgi:hypothetical protein
VEKNVEALEETIICGIDNTNNCRNFSRITNIENCISQPKKIIKILVSKPEKRILLTDMNLGICLAYAVIARTLDKG